MRMTMLIILALGFLIQSGAQEVKDFFTLSKGNETILFLTTPPNSNDAVFVYRKGPLPTKDDFVLLNEENPIRAYIDPLEARILIGPDWDEISEIVDAEGDFAVLRKIRGSKLTGALLSLIYPSVAIVTGRWFLDSTVISSKKYEYKLVYVTEKLQPIDSIQKVVETKEIIPKTPTNLKSQIGDTYVKLTWDYPEWENDFTDLAFRFNVYRKIGSGNYEQINTKPIIRLDSQEKTFTDMFLKNGEKYSYYIAAADPIGRESKQSNIVTVVPIDNNPPETPTGLALLDSERKILLSWDISYDLDAVGYNVYRDLAGGSKRIKLNKKIIQFDNPFYEDSTISSGVQYFYSISCVDKSGNESVLSNPIAIISEDKSAPDPPAKISHKIENKFLVVSWQSSKSKDAAGYNFYLKVDGIESRINTSLINSTSFTYKGIADRGVLPGRVYYVSVSAVDNGGNEGERIRHTPIFVKDDDPPNPPIQITAKNRDGNFIEINVNPSPSADTKSYLLFRVEAGSKNEFTIHTSLTAPFMHHDKGAELGKKYSYSCIAIDTAGNKSEKVTSAEISFDLSIQPSTPVNIVARVKNNQVVIKWNPVVDKYLEGYNVYRSDYPNGVFEKLNSKIIKEEIFTDITGTKSHFYKISSVNKFNVESPMTINYQAK